MKWTIRYYTSESSYKMGCPAYTETVYGDRSSAVNAALRRLKSNPQYKYYDFVQA